MANILGGILNGVLGTATGMITGGPAAAAAQGLGGLVSGLTNSNGGNINSGTDPTVGLQQGMDRAYEYENLILQGQEMAHQTQMQIQSQQFNDVQDEKSEQMREMNTLRDVAMKQRESDDKIVKEFIKTAGGE